MHTMGTVREERSTKFGPVCYILCDIQASAGDAPQFKRIGR